MNIEYNEYNVAKVDVGTVTVATKTQIGKPVDFDKLAKIVDKSGNMFITFKISTTVYKANVNAVITSSGIEFGSIILSSGDPVIVSGLLEKDTTKAYATITITSLSNAKSTTKK